MKKLSIALVFLLTIIGSAMYLFIGNLDQLVKDTIEAEGSAALGSKVRVANVVTDLKQGSVVITNLTIANPDGFQAQNAIEIRSFSADVDYVRQQVNELVIQQPIINAEQKGRRNNFQDMLSKLPAETEPENNDKENQAIISIKRLVLERATVNLISNELSLGNKQIEIEDRSFVMNDFIINDLNGTSSEITATIAKRLLLHISAQVTDHIKKELTQVSKEKAKSKLKEKLGDRLKDLQLKIGKD